ncbi:DUF3105 domain-containing protein [Cryobacterium psychrophilum]|uniref:DUF3105 domain-containing protein n=1 Tax=Cryobacterium psychrophilum TaxID=41988 RepID=A0A4Y8KRS0_9MICO|nr:DUF3105 domain-containing protein [Cryobacterium psychrophilum]TDW28881.1 uncharacterized protein DUF3105 [Cryobacterium psychrophilum]TFD81075.1 DUF3105 domain-containing protein [Cryobacterium psychrophilum]
MTQDSRPTEPSLTERRTARRAVKVATLKREQSKARRNRAIAITIAWSGAAAIVLMVILVVTTNGTSTNLKPGADVNGVQLFANQTSTHVAGTVKYTPLPPVGGDHSAALLNCGVYSEAVSNENAVHSLEHGAAWVTYDDAVVTGDQLSTLQKGIPATYAVLSPFPGLSSPIVVSAWGAQLNLSAPDDSRLAAFMAKYRNASSAPEPGAPCSGGIDGPGKVT